MSTAANESPPRKQPGEAKPKLTAFIAASVLIDTSEIQKALRGLGIAPVTLDQSVYDGQTWVDSLHRCVRDADLVVAIVGDRQRDPNIFFELGFARAMDKPSLLVIPPGYTREAVAPSGVPYLRTDPGNSEAIIFGLRQILDAPPRSRPAERDPGQPETRPLGPAADELLARLRGLTNSPKGCAELKELIAEAIEKTGVRTVSRERTENDQGVDIAVWSNELEPTINNPLLIEVKYSVRTPGEMDAAIGRMVRALNTINNSFGLVIYKEGFPLVTQMVSRSFPVIFIRAEEFLLKLKTTSFRDFVRDLRNELLHG